MGGGRRYNQILVAGVCKDKEQETWFSDVIGRSKFAASFRAAKSALCTEKWVFGVGIHHTFWCISHYLKKIFAPVRLIYVAL